LESDKRGPILKKTAYVSFAFGILLLIAGCGGTWVDDEGNFKRVFGFDKPNDVQVQHSFYWKSNHWGTEYRYYIAFRSSTKFSSGLTDAMLMDRIVPDSTARNNCGDNPPSWFVSRPISQYDMWKPRSDEAYRIFQDKDDGIIYVCDERL
jgi:hypothetical protein